MRVIIVDSDERRGYEVAMREKSMERTRQALEKLQQRVAAGKLKQPEKIGAAAERLLQRNHGYRYYSWDIHQGGFRCDIHLGGGGANLQADLEIDVLTHRDFKIFDFVIGKALLRDCDTVAGRGYQRRSGEHARLGGIHGTFDALAFIGDYDGGARDDRPRSVTDCSGDGAESCRCLRVCTRHKDERAYS